MKKMFRYTILCALTIAVNCKASSELAAAIREFTSVVQEMRKENEALRNKVLELEKNSSSDTKRKQELAAAYLKCVNQNNTHLRNTWVPSDCRDYAAMYIAVAGAHTFKELHETAAFINGKGS